MGAQTDKGSASGKWGLIAASIVGAVLLGASIWSLARALNNSAPPGSVAPANEITPINSALSQAELDRRQYEMAEQRTEPAFNPAAATPAVIPAKPDDAVILQKAKTKVNQRIIERLKQYVKDNPNLDTRDIQEQIKKRETRDPPIQ